LEAVCEFKESCSSLFVRGDRISQEIYDCPISANMPAGGNRFNFLRHLSRERNAPPDGFGFCMDSSHLTSIHQVTPNFTKRRFTKYNLLIIKTLITNDEASQSAG
jgi:hypothetical protein